MCLFPKLIKNPKYRSNKKNKGNVPHMKDARVGYVPIGCGVCMECMKKKANEWRIRLSEDIKEFKNGKFVTLTFSNESYNELAEEIDATGYALDNAIATKAVRRFLERWRKKYKKSVRHWLITELGQTNTEHLHLHGIIYTDHIEQLAKIWKYGFVWTGHTKNGQIINYVSEKTVNYIVKYVTKTDKLHKHYKPKILCSKGIGKIYTKSYNAGRNEYQENGKTRTTYKNSKGHDMALPIYYRNKIYSEEEREQLWIELLDRNVRYVGGEKVNADDYNEYRALVEYYRKLNTELGYGSPNDYSVQKYEHERRLLKQAERRAKSKKQPE